MVEKDYVMRLIKEMVRTLLKLLFNIDLEKSTYDILDNKEMDDLLTDLLKKVDEGQINEAENEIYAMIEDGDKENIKLALLFYSYLNEKEDDFLIEHNFSREEIQEGLQNIADKCGAGGVSKLFFMDI